MNIDVRPHTKLMSAALAAGVFAAAAPVWVPPVREAAPAISTASVLPASLVTDVLYNVGAVIDGATWAAVTPLYAAVSFPFDAAWALIGTIDDPQLAANLASYVAQVYLNPTYQDLAEPQEGEGYYGYAYSVRENLAYLISALPAGLSQTLSGALDEIVARIGAIFEGLPDPDLGAPSFDFLFNTEAGYAAWALREAILAPVGIIARTVSTLGYLPADLSASIDAGIVNPGDIPGLISYLVLSLIDPVDGLLGGIVDDLLLPVTLLPPLIGTGPDGQPGQVENLVNTVTVFLSNLLQAILPAPISPYGAAAAATEAQVEEVTSTEGTFGVLADDSAIVALDVQGTEQAPPAADSGPDPVVLRSVSEDGATVVDESNPNETGADETVVDDSTDETEVDDDVIGDDVTDEDEPTGDSALTGGDDDGDAGDSSGGSESQVSSNDTGDSDGSSTAGGSSGSDSGKDSGNDGKSGSNSDSGSSGSGAAA